MHGRAKRISCLIDYNHGRFCFAHSREFNVYSTHDEILYGRTRVRCKGPCTERYVRHCAQSEWMSEWERVSVVGYSGVRIIQFIGSCSEINELTGAVCTAFRYYRRFYLNRKPPVLDAAGYTFRVDWLTVFSMRPVDKTVLSRSRIKGIDGFCPSLINLHRHPLDGLSSFQFLPSSTTPTYGSPSIKPYSILRVRIQKIKCRLHTCVSISAGRSCAHSSVDRVRSPRSNEIIIVSIRYADVVGKCERRQCSWKSRASCCDSIFVRKRSDRQSSEFVPSLWTYNGERRKAPI